jgi:hypothetical protein
MAFAYLDPAAPLDTVPSPNCSEGSPVGPRALLPEMTAQRRQVDLLAIAEGFAVSAPAIAEIQGRGERSWVLLAVTDLFEAWAIGWPPGGKIELHDHGGSHGAVVVAGGSLTETTIRPTAAGVALIGTHQIGSGEHRRFGPGYVHDLINDGETEAVSVHVYGPRLTAMSYYELDPRGRLDVVRTEDVPPIGPFDTTSDHDPS